MSRYDLTFEAQHDLRQIRDYVLEQGGFRAARYVIVSLITAFRALARTPGQGHRREDLTERPELTLATYKGRLPINEVRFR